MAETVVCYRAMNGRSGVRIGELGKGLPATDEWQFLMPYGIVGPPVWYALWARRHMSMYGTTKEHLGHVAIAQRKWAALNERAWYRDPLTMEAYLSDPMLADPFSALDCCREVDGGCALVVTTAERAKDLRQRPVRITGGAYGTGPGAGRPYDKWDDYSKFYFPLRPVRARGKSAGLGPSDMKLLAQIYDAYTYVVLSQLEDFGFCPKGEGGPFFAEGNTAPGGHASSQTLVAECSTKAICMA